MTKVTYTKINDTTKARVHAPDDLDCVEVNIIKDGLFTEASKVVDSKDVDKTVQELAVENVQPIALKLNLPLSQTLCAEILDTFTSGPSWADVSNTLNDNEGRPISVVIADSEDPNEKWLVDVLIVHTGIQNLIDEADDDSTLLGRILEAVRDNDSCQLDIDDCDTIVQYGLFGKLVYS